MIITLISFNLITLISIFFYVPSEIYNIPSFHLVFFLTAFFNTLFYRNKNSLVGFRDQSIFSIILPLVLLISYSFNSIFFSLKNSSGLIYLIYFIFIAFFLTKVDFKLENVRKINSNIIILCLLGVFNSIFNQLDFAVNSNIFGWINNNIVGFLVIFNCIFLMDEARNSNLKKTYILLSFSFMLFWSIYAGIRIVSLAIVLIALIYSKKKIISLILIALGLLILLKFEFVIRSSEKYFALFGIIQQLFEFDGLESLLDSEYNRLRILASAIIVAKDNFVFGVGPGLENIQFSYYTHNLISYFELKPHNTFVSIILEYGIFPFIVIIVFLKRAFKNFYLYQKLIFFLFIVSTLFVNGFFYNPLFWFTLIKLQSIFYYKNKYTNIRGGFL